MKVILSLLLFLLSCSSLTVEKRKADDCSVTDRPYGWEGRLSVRCRDISFLLIYDNSPDGRDPLILGVEGVEAKKLRSQRRSYALRTGDHETLAGWAFEEEWEVGNYRLRGLEYFVNGGSGCYEEEEVAKIELVRGKSSVELLNLYREETDCGGN